MKKIRNSIVALALIVSLGGSAFLGTGVGSAASVASSHHSATPAVAAKSTRPVAVLIRPWCPSPGITC